SDEMSLNDEYLKIYDCLKDLDNEKYTYLIQNLYSWIEKSKFLLNLGFFIENTINMFDISFNSIREVISLFIDKYKRYSILTPLIASCSDIELIIVEYPTKIDEIVNGLKFRIENQKFEDLSDFIKKLVFSETEEF